MARSKRYLIKDDKKLRIISENKKDNTIKVEGRLTTFVTTLDHAEKSGYKLIKERKDEAKSAVLLHQ